MTAGVSVRETRRTRRWHGLAGAALAMAALGVLTRSGGLLLLAGLGVTLAAYARVAAAPLVSLAVERTLDPAEPAVGEPVTVTLTVENVGERTLADVRVADGVPEGVRVTDGSARRATALRPGAATTLSYTIAGGHARRSFAPARVAVRDVVGLVERRADVAAATDEIAWPTVGPEAVAPLVPPPFGPVGPAATAEGGEGLAFHAVREHRPGDPLSRVDWRRRAKTGEFATVEYRRERTATVVLVVDARPAARVAPAPDAETAIERSVTAAGALAEGLTAAGHRVGLAALGADDGWLPPDRGDTHAERLRRRLDALAAPPGEGAAVTRAGGEGGASDASDAADGGAPQADGDGGATDGEGAATDGEAAVADGDDTGDGDGPAQGEDRAVARDGGGAGERVAARLDPSATVLVCSPLCDEGSARAVRTLAARARSTAVVSPDPTAGETPGRRLAAVERQARLRSLRGDRVAVHDWDRDVSLAALLARLEARS